MAELDAQEVDALYEKLAREAEAAGYRLNPDREFTRALVEGLATNLGRYGYMACPCRRATGTREEDLDVICPCDYRDADLGEYGACYCALYVSKDVVAGKEEAHAIPERRPPKKEDRPQYRHKAEAAAGGIKVWRCRVCGHLISWETRPKICWHCLRRRFEGVAVWRCRVCGYLAARDAPPEECPICKAAKDRFEPFAFSGG
jgi:ferredoxin-thioredoxin reductase catalytic chain